MSSTTELTSLIFTFGRIMRERTVTDGSVSYLHLATLHYVEEAEQPLMREIAQHLRVTPPSATSLVNTLVKQGELRRVPDAADRRAIRLALTAQGRITLRDGMKCKHDLIRQAVEGLNERERISFKHILEKIIHIAAEHS